MICFTIIILAFCLIFLIILIVKNSKKPSTYQVNEPTTTEIFQEEINEEVLSNDLDAEENLSVSEISYKLGLNLIDNKRYLQAIEQFTIAINNERNANYYNYRAICKNKLRDYNGAIDDYTEAISIKHQEPLYLIERGLVYISINRTDLAILDWEKAQQFGSNRASELINLNRVPSLNEVEVSLRRQQNQNTRNQERQSRERIRLQEEQQRQQDATQTHAQLRRVQDQTRLNATITRYKANWRDFQTIVQQNNITRLYHFTDRSNLQSIMHNGGLLLWYYCQQNNISISRPGGSSTSWILDERKGLQNFVRVSFVRDHPMMFVAQDDGRITRPVVLEINPDVIYLRNTKYSCQNAAKNGVTADGTLEMFNSIRFPLLRRRYFDLDPEDKSFYQAEVLILEKVPLEYITNINSV